MECQPPVHPLEPVLRATSVGQSIYGQQQQQLQAVQQALSNGGNLNNERLSYFEQFFHRDVVVERNRRCQTGRKVAEEMQFSITRI